MIRSPHIRVEVNLTRVAENARAIRQRTGVPVIAVVKADAYGLGAPQVVRALADVVESFYTLTPAEAFNAAIPATGKTTISMLHENIPPDELRAARIRPCVFSLADAVRYAPCDPLLSVDVGMQRFGCPPHECREILSRRLVREALAHGTKPEHAAMFRAVVDSSPVPIKKHIAASALLPHEPAHFDATRPGLALYTGAVRVSTHLIDARDTHGPAGYGGFITTRHGVFHGGYSHAMRRGIVHVNSSPRRIMEVGMQSAFIELLPTDKLGDEVVLLGDGLTEDAASAAASAAGFPLGQHEILLRACSMGQRVYV